MDSQEFARRLCAWQREKGRKNLPWFTSDPYRRWLSEIMLQQTQVSVVTDYFARFLRAFPAVEDLANASEEDVMRLWSGLGYYSRARNLHKAAKQVAAAGHFPQTRYEWERVRLRRSQVSATGKWLPCVTATSSAFLHESLLCLIPSTKRKRRRSCSSTPKRL